MIYGGEHTFPISQGAILAQAIMSEENNEDDKQSMKDDWDPDSSGTPNDAMFKPEELDIYVNKVTNEAYIFHGKEVDYEALERLEYDAGDNSVTVHKKDGSTIDLGVKIQWLIRPYFKNADEVSIVQTKDGESINGSVLPLIHKNSKDTE